RVAWTEIIIARLWSPSNQSGDSLRSAKEHPLLFILQAEHGPVFREDEHAAELVLSIQNPETASGRSHTHLCSAGRVFPEEAHASQVPRCVGMPPETAVLVVKQQARGCSEAQGLGQPFIAPQDGPDPAFTVPNRHPIHVELAQ